LYSPPLGYLKTAGATSPTRDLKAPSVKSQQSSKPVSRQATSTAGELLSKPQQQQPVFQTAQEVVPAATEEHQPEQPPQEAPATEEVHIEAPKADESA